ncbi:ABC transporter permease [Microlunatus soli]|uniref:Teichoic acid transport system permease protein n=1 Tax=Microlunatus soli TaxID=630515 RepID=A0A1H1UMW1_9ACTN|nr:ABC transporter permease [Microlunatus soli]SDS73874.1 teichoic acid transport system permease protein [Microlunatus soli]
MPVQGAPTDAPVYQHFSPHRAGLPNVVEYFRSLWQRRQFAAEMSRAKMRGANTNTFFGQAWLVLNPLLQAGVYFLMIMLIRGGIEHPAAAKERIGHLTGSLFLFSIFQVSMSSGAKSVTTAGKVLLNTNFPRLLIPLSAVRTAFFRFLPTIPLYLVIHAIVGDVWSWRMLLSVFFAACLVVFSMGMAALVSTMTVYFRDTASFLPYLMRMWLYGSPILWSADDMSQLPRVVQAIVQVNPTFSMLTGYSDLLQKSEWPDPYVWVTSAAWAAAAVIVGFLFFISREREFAVRVL